MYSQEYRTSVANKCAITYQVIKDNNYNEMNILKVINGSGLSFDILLDKGMDIGKCFFNNKNIVYISKNGYVSTPNYIQKPGSFMNYFVGGLLTTCGLLNVGPECTIDNEFHGLHGGISNKSVSNYNYRCGWINNEFCLSITGTIYESKSLYLTRTITTKYGSNKISIDDVITNKSTEIEKLMYMYHFNFSHPLISPDAILSIPSSNVIPRDKEAQKGLHISSKFEVPRDHYDEQVFFHSGFKNKEIDIKIANEVENISLDIKYNNLQLPKLTQWKIMSNSDYVLGIEPGLSRPIGRDVALKTNEITIINPEEQLQMKVEIEFNIIKDVLA